MLVDMQGKFSGNLAEISWKCIGTLGGFVGTDWTCIGNLMKMWRNFSEHVPEIEWKYSGELVGTCWKFSGHVSDFLYKKIKEILGT